jgi:hypothetical protein
MERKTKKESALVQVDFIISDELLSFSVCNVGMPLIITRHIFSSFAER